VQVDNKVILEQIKELSKLLQSWSDELIIGGGVALILYDIVFSQSRAGAVGTMDIDYLIPRKPVKTGSDKISTILMKNGFKLRNKSLDSPSVQSFIKNIKGVEFEIEFLTDSKSRKNEEVNHLVYDYSQRASNQETFLDLAVLIPVP
jgi:hypothetical protein